MGQLFPAIHPIGVGGDNYGLKLPEAELRGIFYRRGNICNALANPGAELRGMRSLCLFNIRIYIQKQMKAEYGQEEVTTRPGPP
jgi:hypothetical protein